MKSLYSILGVPPDASVSQIETAYATQLSELGTTPTQDDRVRLTALKEAYSVLSDPTRRQLYNQKLFAPQTLSTGVSYAAPVEVADTPWLDTKKILLIGLIALVGVGYYSHQAKEREKMRIEHERQLKMREVQVLEDKARMAQAEQEARLERQRQYDEERKARLARAEHEKFIRDAERQRLINERTEQQNRQREQAEERAAEARKRAELAEAQQRVARDKAALQRIERDRYGRTLTY